jgi:hypothetical protein
MDFNCLHAAENKALDALSLLVQSFESVPLSLLKLSPREMKSATVLEIGFKTECRLSFRSRDMFLIS